MRKIHCTGLVLGVSAAALLASGASAEVDQRTPAVLAAVQAEMRGKGFAPDARYAIAYGDLNDDHFPDNSAAYTVTVNRLGR